MRRSLAGKPAPIRDAPPWSTTESMPDLHPLTGLVLTGGGARAAYQVGVLKALAEIRRQSTSSKLNPFPVITGTSAGAINAAALACAADDFDAAVAGLCRVWENFSAEQ